MKSGDTLKTLSDLVELPIGSVIRTGTARVAQKTWLHDDAHVDEWVETGDSTPCTSTDFDDYPHLLLYVGGQLS